MIDFEELINEGPYVVYMANYSKNFPVIFISSNIARLTGFKNEEIIQNPAGFLEMVHPEDRHSFEEEPVSKSSDNFKHRSYRLLTKNGEYIRVLDKTRLNRNKNGQIEFITGYINQVCQETVVEKEVPDQQKELERQNNIYQALLKTIPIGVFMVEAGSGKPLIANEKALELLGRGILPDANKTNLQEVYQAYNVITKQIYEIEKMPIILGMHGITAHVDDMMIIRPDGTEILLEVFGSPVYDKSGNIWASLVSFFDITTRKRNEEQREILKKELQYTKILLQAAFNQSPVPMALVTFPDNAYKYINKAAEEFLLIDSIAYLSKSPDEISISWKEKNADGTLLQPMETPMMLALQGKTTRNKETLVERHDGSLKWQLANVALILDDNENLIAGIVVFQDITESKQIMIKLQESEAKYRNLFENAQEGIFQTTPEGFYLSANPALAKMYGFKTPQELIQSRKDISADAYVEPNERKTFIELIEKQGHVKGYEYAVKRKDGQVSWFYEDARVIRDNQGNTMYYEGFVVDITKRKQAEDLIRENETLLKSYQMIAGLGSYILDIGTGNWKSSNILDNIFGIDENYKKNIEGWLSMIHPDWQETMQKYFTEEVIGKGKRFNKEYKITRISNKEVRWVHGLGELEYDNYGKPCRMLGTIMDITTRKKSEEKLKENEEKLSTLFGAMTEMVVLHEVVFDEQGKAINYRITDCNKAFTQITGISREFAIGKLATEVYQSETPPYLEEFTQVGITGQPYEYTTYYAPMDKHFIISVVCPRSGTFATITTDITDIKQIEEIVSSKNKELENYLYVASHDLRSPLVNIQGFSQRLNKQATQLNEIISVTDMSHDQKSEIEKIVLEGFPKTLEFIYTNINKMDKLITGLLQISRTGRMKMNIQKMDMNFLLDKITKSYSFQMEEIKGQFKMNELSGCYGDPDMLSQLFSNIIENAIKYRDENKKLIIRISSQNMYKKVLYLVEDNGIGISQRHSEKIWDVFYRVNAQGNEKGEGIGLSIVKRIVDKHKGKIWMKSVEGEGTTFFIELLDKTFNEHV